MLRRIGGQLCRDDSNPIQLQVALLRYAVQTLRFRDSSALQKQWALAAACSLTDEATSTLASNAARMSPEAWAGLTPHQRRPINWGRHQQRAATRLTVPVLAMGGEKGGGQSVAQTMKLVADDVQGAVIAGSGHWIAEEAPEEVLAAVTRFLAAYHDGPATAQTQAPVTAAD